MKHKTNQESEMETVMEIINQAGGFARFQEQPLCIENGEHPLLLAQYSGKSGVGGADVVRRAIVALCTCSCRFSLRLSASDSQAVRMPATARKSVHISGPQSAQAGSPGSCDHRRDCCEIPTIPRVRIVDQKSKTICGPHSPQTAALINSLNYIHARPSTRCIRLSRAASSAD